jgi:hypothetical protein
MKILVTGMGVFYLLDSQGLLEYNAAGRGRKWIALLLSRWCMELFWVTFRSTTLNNYTNGGCLSGPSTRCALLPMPPAKSFCP